MLVSELWNQGQIRGTLQIQVDDMTPRDLLPLTLHVKVRQIKSIHV